MGGGGGGRRYHGVGAMVGWILGGRFNVSESMQLYQSIVVSKTTFGVATSGVTPERLVSERCLIVNEFMYGRDEVVT